MKRLLLDTSVLIFALQQAPTNDDPTADQRWRDVQQLLGEASTFKFLIATPTVAEVLALVRSADRSNAVKELSAAYLLVAFDLKAAEIAGSMWRFRPPTGGRQVIKVDIQIGACAVRAKAYGFCTYDKEQAERVRHLAPTMAVGPPGDFISLQTDLPYPTSSTAGTPG